MLFRSLSRADLQDLADRLLAKGLDPSTIRNTLMPLRAIYRRALSRGEVSLNPTTGIELPAVRGRRDRIATPEQAAALIAAAPENDRALWATAFYAGLRRGELMALRWEDIDLDDGLIRVERSWDMREGLIEPKSRAGTRAVPIAGVLREHLAAHALKTGRRSGLAFDRSLLFRSNGIAVDVFVPAGSGALHVVHGQVVDERLGLPIASARIRLGKDAVAVDTDVHGQFAVSAELADGDQNLYVEADNRSIVCAIPVVAEVE